MKKKKVNMIVKIVTVSDYEEREIFRHKDKFLSEKCGPVQSLQSNIKLMFLSERNIHVIKANNQEWLFIVII